MSGGLVDKVYIGLDNAPAGFDIKGRILGPNGTNLEYIRSETGVVAVLKGDKFEPLHLALHHARSDAIAAAKSLALNLIETIKAELVQWSTAQAGGAPPAMNVPPPSLATTTQATPAPPASSVTMSTVTSLTSSAPQTMPAPVVSVAQANQPLMTVRQPTMLQLMPQQQYVLNQENGQLIPIVQPGHVSNQLTSLPLAQSLGSLQQQNFGTQLVDFSGMQPMNVTQLRLSGVPSSMSMILPNGLLPQASISTGESTTVSPATSTPVVCAAQGTNSSQKILYSVDKSAEKIQGTDTVQWALPGGQTMLIPYQQLQDSGLTGIQPQQFVSIAPAGGFQQTSLPLSAAQLQQLQTTGAVMQLNHKSPSTPQKVSQEPRGQKRLSDGNPSQLQLRPIAPAGSQLSQEKTAGSARAWQGATGRENTVVSMGMKINPAHGTIIHVSSGQQASVSTSAASQDGMYVRQVDRNAIQIQSKDTHKQEITNKIQTAAQNVQMIQVPPGMTVLQNPLNIGQMQTMFGQHNNQVYMIPANQQNVGLQSMLGQQVLQSGQNVTVMQPNQLAQNSMQYNVPLMGMNMQPNAQYINLNTPLSAQQLNAALSQQYNANLAVSGGIPIVQPGSPMPQAIPVSQQQTVQQILPQNQQFLTPTSQYSIGQQYVMQTSQPNQTVQYNVQTASQVANGTAAANSAAETDAPAQSQTYIASSQESFQTSQNQTNFTENASTYATANQSAPQTYSVPTTQPPAYAAPAGQPYAPAAAAQSAPHATQASYSPSSTPAPSYAQNSFPTPGNPYPNATGQNMAAYASNQYQYNMQTTNRPWFRPRYAGPQSPYGGGPAPPAAPPAAPPPAAPMAVPPPPNNYNYWTENS